MEKGLAMYRKSLDSIAVVASALLLAGACLSPGRAIADSGSAPGGVQLAGWDMAPDRITTVDIDPGLLVTLDQAAATYKQLAAADVASAVANIDKMLVALEASDAQTARQAFIDGRAAYKRCKVLTVKFPYLASGIDPRHDSRVGFRAIEAKLFTPGAPLPLAEAQALSDKLHTFRSVFAAEPVYAHGVMAGIYFRVHGLGEGLNESSGEGKIGSRRYWLIDRQNEVAGIELAWNTVFSAAVKKTTAGVDDRVQKGFVEVNRLLGVASFDQLDVPAFETTSQMLADAISDAVLALGWRPPRPEDAED
jgi:hypothetical protein